MRNSKSIVFCFVFIKILQSYLCLNFDESKPNVENRLHDKTKQSSARSISSIGIFNNPDCSIVKEYCGIRPGNYVEIQTLVCIQRLSGDQRKNIPDSCQHDIWSRLSMYTNDTYVRDSVRRHCQQEDVILDCEKSNIMNFLNCVLENKEILHELTCRSFVQSLKWVVFSDFRLLKRFVKSCEQNIARYSCGRLPLLETATQTETLACLQMHVDNLDIQCQQEILHLSELQSDNIKLDRVLDTACSDDQIRFCQDIPQGSPSLLKCLLHHKYDNAMTKKCQDQLARRQKLIAQDYKVSKGLARACKDDIRLYHCRKGVSDDKDVRLAQILMCLENVLKNNTKISSDCQSEMVDHRKMLMEDYRLSPEIMRDCANDIITFCNGIETGGKTIHCLMENARPKRKKDKRITSMCQRSLESLIQEADVGEDWRVDPILRAACKPVVDAGCRELLGGDGRVMSCLMEKIGTRFMNEQCETALMQIQYFLVRDFKLDPQLYKACKKDAIHYCHAKPNWVDQGLQMDPERGPLVLPCLYKYAYNTQDSIHLSSTCVHEVRRVMRQRAISVDLLPEIEDMCIDDLARSCYDNTAKGEEMECLQDKLNSLSEKCRTAVSNFTEAQAGHVELNPVIRNNCRNIMEKHCNEIFRSGQDDGNMMECLIAHKNEPEVRADVKCRASIEHFQIISLKNYKFTRKFKDACRSYVVRYCPSGRTKAEVIKCLSERVRNDTLNGNRPSIQKDCRQQIKNQLFQQRENIDLDPELKKACMDDLNSFCQNVDHGSSLALECLQTFKGKLRASCQHAIFSIRKQEFADNSIDYNLISTCTEMIDLFCHNTEPSQVLECLRLNRQDVKFDEKCKVVVVHRMIEQNTDYRFNPRLQSACKPDIKKFCIDTIAKEPQDKELQGKVVSCLKKMFRESQLSDTCQIQLVELLKEQAVNFRLDPLISTLCDSEIQTICKPSDNSDINSNGEVEECLKTALVNHKIVDLACAQEVARLLEDTSYDISADPLLQKACTLDLLKYCHHLDAGAGRHLKCLKIILEDDERHLETECKTELSKRMEMYRYAAKIDSAENFEQLYRQITNSSSSNYILMVLFICLSMIFVMGALCGRLMMRRARVMKLK